MEQKPVEPNVDNPLSRWAAVADELGTKAELPLLTNASAGAFIDEVQALANANVGLPPMGMLVPALQRAAECTEALARSLWIDIDRLKDGAADEMPELEQLEAVASLIRHVAVGIAAVTLVAGHHARAAAELEKL